MIDYWQQKMVGKITVNGALELADSFADDCKGWKAIPMWAFALRALAGRIRLLEQAREAN